MEKIVLFGTGKRANRIFEYVSKHGEFEIVEIWDNDRSKIGTMKNINGKQIIVQLPHYQNECNIVISTGLYFEEIKDQLTKELSIHQSKIKKSTYLLNGLKHEIIDKYRNVKDKEINEICHYLRNNDLDVFLGQIEKDYPRDLFEIFKDEENGLLYSFWHGKKIYLSSKYSEKEIAQAYLSSLCREQDTNSPHCYNIDKLDLDENTVFIDGGAAEGFFALQIIEKVKHAYIVECDRNWVEALKYTFEPYESKVTIVEKCIDKFDSETTISLDAIAMSDCEEEKIVIKLDIEGKENDAIHGMTSLIESEKDMMCIVCTYHKSEDEKDIFDYFSNSGFDVSFSKGFMFFPYEQEIKAELRKAVLFAKR